MSGLTFRQIHKRYGDSLPYTIRDVNLDIQDGEFIVFVGPSGCGKSTLLRMVAGLETITSGELKIGERVVNDLPAAQRGVAMVFQSYALYPHMTVQENMSFGLRTMGQDPAACERKVKEAARILHLEPLLDRLPKALSGGQRQRVAIGRAIVREPQVFLFDEPLSNLDAALRVQTRLEIAKLHRDIGTASMIYVTHDQVEAMTLASRIVLLRAGADVQSYGSVAQFGAPLELFHRPRSLFVAGFIGSPKMNFLPATLVSAGDHEAEVVITQKTFTARVRAQGEASGAQVTLGMRPEHMEIVAAGTPGTLDASVRHVERLGDANYVYVDAKGCDGLLTVRLDPARLAAVGDFVGLALPAEHAHLFRTSGEALAFERSGELPV
jgi:multiple sugar transport system ATP-binding protein